ncbi:hypothetical protein Lal_00005997 [Lupinus albus]|uniref:Putative transcription factor ZF-HD family n=1 Tax=Lupinus albus TaxID=3870 RepID=A0A6A4QG71_LUPAL|nr:putative transcription factor ZF-HD family [Lupinus albus]KAF1879530.1 hypothetical protein Lal_00005997 [Lupinus albus]
MDRNTPTPAKPVEPESDTPTRIQQPINNTAAAVNIKPLSFSNGVLKRHHHPHHQSNIVSPTATVAVTAVTYKECLKNHAASLGGHAVDGCGEFMTSPNVTTGDPSSIKCAACGCHRNFHRRDPEEPPIPTTTTHVIEYQPHHRHHPPPPPPPPQPSRSPNSVSPPPISSSYYPSAPHMLLALSGGLSVPPESTAAPANHAAVAAAMAAAVAASSPRKRFRTKFSQEQKEKMQEFAERVGWKMQKRDEDLVMEFCNEVGVDRSVLKVWMHNNKNTFGKKDVIGVTTNTTNGVVLEHLHNNVNDSVSGGNQDHNNNINHSSGANGSSSS